MKSFMKGASHIIAHAAILRMDSPSTLINAATAILYSTSHKWMQRQFEHEEYKEQYGSSPPPVDPQDQPFRYHSPRTPADHRFTQHPGRREEYQNHAVAPHFHERMYTDNEIKDNYLFNRRGTVGLQLSDFQMLGFAEPEKSCQIISDLHYPLNQIWESNSKYEGYRCGPDTKAMLSSTAFTPLKSKKPNDVINWINKFADTCLPFNIGICPFGHIEPIYDKCGICLPGVGDKYY
jgi:hypothetical protein